MTSNARPNVFKQQKTTNLAKADLSRKGSIDEPIVDLVNFINNHDHYFTTSSCSGRTYLFEEGEDEKKKGCVWLYTTHGFCDAKKLIEALGTSTGNAFLKFEPFILHVQCETLAAAQLMHVIAVATGYRNSGITVGKKGKIITAVRSTQSLEVPLTNNGQLLVDHNYVEYLVTLVNNKMKENFERLQGFYEKLTSDVGEDSPSLIEDVKRNNKTKHKRRQEAFTELKHSQINANSENSTDVSHMESVENNLSKEDLEHHEDDQLWDLNTDLFNSESIYSNI